MSRLEFPLDSSPLPRAARWRHRPAAAAPRRALVALVAFVVLVVLGDVPAAQALPTAPGYTVGFVTTPGTATGDVVSVSGALFVGSGDFGAGAQSLVRIDPGGTTVLADGFNALAGLDYDPVNDRLVAGDNAGDVPGATTGDTLYAVADPFGSPATPAAAAGLELLPSGSLPGLADLVLDPTDPTRDRLFASDASASFPPDGSVVEVALSLATTTGLASGLAFSAGLATDGSTLFVGESLLDFSGRVSTLDLGSPGAPQTLATLPSGIFDLEIGPDGALYATTGGEIVRIDPGDGSVETVASGFGFAAGLFVDAAGVIYAIDGFPAPGEADRVWILTPVPEPGALALVAGGLAGLAGARRRRRG